MMSCVLSGKGVRVGPISPGKVDLSHSDMKKVAGINFLFLFSLIAFRADSFFFSIFSFFILMRLVAHH